MRVFVAGATGAIGGRLVPLLVAEGHQVTASTRSKSRFDLLRGWGAEPVQLDGLDGPAVGEAIGRAEPEVIIHQMTALSGVMDFRHFDRWFATTNELRTAGTDHLLAAARACGVRRFIAQSYTGWPNDRTGGGPPRTEQDPLDPEPPAAQRQTLAAIRYLERAVTAAPLVGVVLRYGSLYGPGASEVYLDVLRKRKMPLVGRGTGIWSWTHVDDAAAATALALTMGKGVYNIVDDEPAQVSSWLPFLAAAVGAKPPIRVPVWLARLAAGEVVVSIMTQIQGSSNAAAKRDLHWQPSWASWRDGFRDGLNP